MIHYIYVAVLGGTLLWPSVAYARLSLKGQLTELKSVQEPKFPVARECWMEIEKKNKWPAQQQAIEVDIGLIAWANSCYKMGIDPSGWKIHRF